MLSTFILIISTYLFQFHFFFNDASRISMIQDAFMWVQASANATRYYYVHQGFVNSDEEQDIKIYFLVKIENMFQQQIDILYKVILKNHYFLNN